MIKLLGKTSGLKLALYTNNTKEYYVAVIPLRFVSSVLWIVKTKELPEIRYSL